MYSGAFIFLILFMYKKDSPLVTYMKRLMVYNKVFDVGEKNKKIKKIRKKQSLLLINYI